MLTKILKVVNSQKVINEMKSLIAKRVKRHFFTFLEEGLYRIIQNNVFLMIPS